MKIIKSKHKPIVIGRALNSAKKGKIVTLRLGTPEELRAQDINNIIENLKLLWLKYPDQRLGQLLENYVLDISDSFHQSDEGTLALLKRKIKHLKCK
jgi:hypothetical protein